MEQRGERQAPSVEGGASRRFVLRGIACAGVMVTSLAAHRAAGAAQDATPDAALAPSFFAGETFVGATSDPNAFLAIVVAEGAAGEPREARAYLCNAADIVEWFDQGGVTGEGGGQLDLRSASGLQLVGQLTAAGATGTITLPDGETLTFETQPATGADGLYTFVVTPDGRVEGGSASGASIDGELQIAGEITLPDGEAIPYAWPVKIDDTAELRTIYRVESGRRGEGRTRKGTRLVVEP